MKTLWSSRVATRFVLLTAAFAGLAQQAGAWTVSYGYHFDQSNYVVAAGGTVPVNVYVRETFDPGDATLLDSEGLLGAGVRVRFDVPPAPVDPAEVLAISDISINSAFDGSSGTDLVSGASAGFFSAVDFFSPAVTATSGSGFNEIYLGTFLFTAGLLAGEVTNLRATDFDTGTDEFLTDGSFLVLDPLIGDASATITVPAPEPSSIALGISGLVTAGAFLVRRLRKSSFASKCFKVNDSC